MNLAAQSMARLAAEVGYYGGFAGTTWLSSWLEKFEGAPLETVSLALWHRWNVYRRAKGCGLN